MEMRSWFLVKLFPRSYLLEAHGHPARNEEQGVRVEAQLLRPCATARKTFDVLELLQ